MPKLSVLMPVYNVENYLEESLCSVLNQTFTDFELLIIDDGSTDSTPSILDKYAQLDKRVKLYSSSNQKVANALNQLVTMANGKYSARMDGDDICLPTRFEKQISVLEASPNIGVLGSWVKTFGSIKETWHYRTQNNFSRALIANGVTALCHPSWMLKTDYLIEQPYDDKYRYITDRAWLTHFSLYNPEKLIVAIPEVLLNYRVHSASVTGLHFDKMEAKTRKLLTWYYAQLGLALNDEQISSFCDVIYSKKVDAERFKLAMDVYQQAFIVYTNHASDEFFAFKEKWIKFCNINKADFIDEIIPVREFAFFQQKPQ